MSFGSDNIMGGISADVVCPVRTTWKDAMEGLDDSGGVGKARWGGEPLGVGAADGDPSATVGDCKGDEAGGASFRQFTRSGGRRGVVAQRSRSISSTLIVSMAFAFPTSMAMVMATSLSIGSPLVKGEVGAGEAYSSVRSAVET